MANSEAGGRVGGAGRQREYIGGENWEKGFGVVAREGGHQAPASQVYSNPQSKSKI